MWTSRSIEASEASANLLRTVLSFCAWNLRDPGIAHVEHVARTRATDPAGTTTAAVMYPRAFDSSENM